MYELILIYSHLKKIPHSNDMQKQNVIFIELRIGVLK